MKKNKASLFLISQPALAVSHTCRPILQKILHGSTGFTRLPFKVCSPNSVCLRLLQWCFCTRCKLGTIFPTCPGLQLCSPRNTSYAHARYLVMVSRRFYGKKHCFYTCSSAAMAKNTLIINVSVTYSHKTPPNTLFLITRGSPDFLWARAVLGDGEPSFL